MNIHEEASTALQGLLPEGFKYLLFTVKSESKDPQVVVSTTLHPDSAKDLCAGFIQQEAVFQHQPIPPNKE